MKTLWKELFFDKEMVDAMQESALDDARLYNLLFAGKITLQEYLRATA